MMLKKKGRSQSGPAGMSSGTGSPGGAGMAMGGYVGDVPPKGRTGGKAYQKGGPVLKGAKAGAMAGAVVAGAKAGKKKAKGYMKGGVVKDTTTGTKREGYSK